MKVVTAVTQCTPLDWSFVQADFATKINSMAKFVASTTLKEPLAWNNSTLLKGDTAQAVAKLKQQPGQNIVMYECGKLAYLLLQHGLVYRHFPRRADLIAAVFRRELDACAASARGRLVPSPGP